MVAGIDTSRKIAVVLKSRRDRGRSGVMHILREGSEFLTICGQNFEGYKIAAVWHGECERCTSSKAANRKFVTGSAANTVKVTRDQVDDAMARFRADGGLVTHLPAAQQPDRIYVHFRTAAGQQAHFNVDPI